ncbi:MAG: hypothetical protein ACLP07_10855 [Terracidiphilus sp.]
MKSSLIPIRTSNAALRLVLPAILAGSLAIGCGPQAAQAQQWQQAPPASQSSLVGQWRTVLQGNTVTITIEANGQYMQVGVPQNGGTPLAQGGPYQLIAPNTIVFTVTDWSPKSKIILVPCGIPNDPVCNVQRVENIPQPPGSRYAYVFNGPNSMTLNNEQAKETITFTRVTAQ